MNILFISSFAIITTDAAQSRALFMDTFGLPLKQHEGTDYYSSEKIEGCKHFGLWPLIEAARACFGSDQWPADRVVPQTSVEFEVADAAAVAAAEAELASRGYELIHPTRCEPWGQTITRLLTPEGAIVGVSHAPWLHASKS